jgi:hypothetical protein
MIYGVECYFYCLEKRSIRTCRSRPTSRFPGYTPRLQGTFTNNKTLAGQPASNLAVCVLVCNSALDLIAEGIADFAGGKDLTMETYRTRQRGHYEIDIIIIRWLHRSWWNIH